ncbi:MAG: TonB-dependent receptor [Candidatus Zixiibacteriota bacterium]
MLPAMLLFLAATVSGDTTVYEDNPVQVDPIVVVGKREPERLSRMVNSAISVSPEKMNASSEDNLLSHLAFNHSSISITSVTGTGFGLGSRGQGKLLIRGLGFSPNRGSLVLIDGRPDIAGLFGHPLPDTYRKAGLYSAELVKGGASTLYGSNAIAGVLDLQSFYRPDLERFTSIELSGGSYATLDGSFRHSRRFGNMIAAGWYEYVESDNHRDNSEYFNRSGGFRLHHQSDGGLEWFLSGRYTSFDYTDAGPVYSPSRFTGDVQRSGLTLGIDKRVARYSLSARLYNSYGEHSFSDGFNSVDRNNGIDLFGRVKGLGDEGLSVSGGFSFNYLGGSAHNGTSSIHGGDFSETEYAGHFQVEYDIHQLVDLTVGGRLIEHERYGSHIVYQAGVVVSPKKAGSIKLSIGTAYRNPTVSESQLFAISNAESLKPEEGVFYEIGYFKRVMSTLSVEGALFWREGENLIAVVTNPSPPPLSLYQNAGSYRHRGWEASLRYATGAVAFNPSFTHLNQKDLNLSVPEDKFVAAGSLTMRNFRLNLEAVAAFNTASDSAGVPVILDDYMVVNVDGRYSISSLADLTLRIENLFDRDYQVVHGYPMPGITFRGRISLQVY